jgi:hypothetical protein
MLCHTVGNRQKITRGTLVWTCGKTVETSHEGNPTTLLNLQVKTDKIIPNHKPNIIICNNEKGTRVLTDGETSEDRNVIKKEEKVILKYI